MNQHTNRDRSPEALPLCPSCGGRTDPHEIFCRRCGYAQGVPMRLVAELAVAAILAIGAALFLHR